MATSVRVTATVVGTMIATQSSVLVISTGLPDQDSFSWAVSCPNIEAYNYDGVENDVTVILSDRFQNPVPDGTAISFNAEGGSIESNCQTNTPTATRSGTCTVTWTSADPRPTNGRVTVMAHAIGEESFVDVNSNGFFDDADSFTDLAEIFRDDNEMNGYEAGEFFFDFDADATYDTGNALYDGLLCGGPLGVLDTLLRCSTSQTTGIGKNGIIIMSGSVATITDSVAGTLAAPGAVTFTIGDARSQPMPAGTTVKLTTGNGTIIGPSNLPVPCTSFDGPLNFSFFIDADSTPSTGIAVLEVETPGPGVGAAAGVITVYFIAVTD